MRVKLIEGKSKGLDCCRAYTVEDIFPDGNVTIRIYGRAGISKRYAFRKEHYNICECAHINTKDDRCIECGKLIFATEARPCSECKCFHEYKDNWSSCKKKLMAVTHNMKVYYKIEEGTCFESAEKLSFWEEAKCES